LTKLTGVSRGVSSVTATFTSDGKVSGLAGFNKVSHLGSTRKSCSAPTVVMTQEAAYLAALNTAATYQIRGSKLELRTASGAIAADFDGI
jgi:heat shock protein HslJ